MSNIYCALRCTFSLATLLLCSTSSAQVAARTPKQLYQEAAAAIRAADYEASIAALEKLVAHEDQSLAEVARPHLAELYLATGNNAKALSFAEKSLANTDLSTSPDVAATTRFERVCLKAAVQSPSLPDRRAALERLVSRLEAGKTQAAKGDTADEMAGNDQTASDILPAAALALVRTLLAMDEFSAAASLADQHGQLDAAIAHYRERIPLLAAKKHFANNRIRECESSLATLDIEGLPEDEQIAARFLLLECSLRAGKLQQATVQSDWFDALMENYSEPPSWAATLRLRQAELFVARRDYAKAHATVQLSKLAHPDFKLMYEFDFLSARIAIATIDFAAADSTLQQIKTQHSIQTAAGIRARWMHGELEFMRRRYASAAALYEEVAACQQPEWKPLGLLQLAKCQELLGESEKAIASYRLVLQQGSGAQGAANTNTAATQEARRRIAALQSSEVPKR